MFVEIGWLLVKAGLVLTGSILILFIFYATIRSVLVTIFRMHKTEVKNTKPSRPMGLVTKRKEDVND